MYSNDGAVLGASTVAAPIILGIALWPQFALIFIGAAFVILGGLFFLFKYRRNRG
jgi:LPXTG-motif cell wall-anchored protein